MVSTRDRAAFGTGVMPHGGRRGAAMGALRKAGVWLGLVEDDDDHEYDDAPAETYSRASSRQSRRADDRSRDRYEDDFDDDEDLDLAVTRPRERVPSRLALEAERDLRDAVPRTPMSR